MIMILVVFFALNVDQELTDGDLKEIEVPKHTTSIIQDSNVALRKASAAKTGSHLN